MILPANISHVYALAPVMRADDALEATGLGGEPKRMLRQSFRHSLIAKSAFVDGDVACMWGMTADILSDIGSPWLVTSAAVERLPLAFLHEARREVEAMLCMKRRLENIVAAAYTRAVRFLRLLGFTIGDIIEVGPAKTPFHRFSIEAA